MSRVLLITINYAPEPTGIAVNSTRMGEALAAAGHQVDVIAGVPHYPDWRIAPAYQHGLRRREQLDSVTVYRVRHFVPRRHNAIARGFYEATFAANAALLKLPQPPDVVVGVIPALAAGWLAKRFARRSRAPWGVVFADLVGRAAGQSGYPGGAAVSGLVTRTELGIARAADGVAVISEGFRGYLESGGVAPDKVARIVNVNLVRSHEVSAPESRDGFRKRQGWRPDEFVVLHTGNMGFKQGLENVIEAAALLRDEAGFRFILAGDGNRREALEQLVKKRRLANFEFRGLFDDSDFRTALGAADALILNQASKVADMSLPGKLSNYLASGTPVLVAAAATSEAVREASGTGVAVLLPPDEPAELARALLQLRNGTPGRADTGASSARSYESHRLTSARDLNIKAFIDRLLQSPEPG